MSKEALVDVAMAVAENIDRDFARSLLKNTLIALLKQKQLERKEWWPRSQALRARVIRQRPR